VPEKKVSETASNKENKLEFKGTSLKPNSSMQLAKKVRTSQSLAPRSSKNVVEQ
jgi:hypothetical protein